jgi:Flp pilus assembly protein TadD
MVKYYTIASNLKEARTLTPRFKAAWKKEALLLKKLGKTEEAKSAAKKYLELAPTDEDFRRIVSPYK